MNRLARYKDTVKHLRVVRNVVTQHLAAIGETKVDDGALTPYERGRLCRSLTKVGNNIIELWHDDQATMAFWFASYAYNLVESPGVYTKPGSGNWHQIWIMCQNLLGVDCVDLAQATDILRQVGECLDLPYSKIGSRIALMRLSLG